MRTLHQSQHRDNSEGVQILGRNVAITEPTTKQYAAYEAGQDRRARIRRNRDIPPIFADAKNKSTEAIVDVLNNRRYLKIDNNVKRMRAIARDPKMKQVANYFKQAGQRSLKAIHENLVPHYEEEAPMAMKHLYPALDSVIDNFNVNVSEKKAAKLRTQPIEGRAYTQWAKINTDNYVTQWESSFRRIMTQNVTTNGFTSRDTQLISSVIKLFSTFESKINTIFMDAMNNVSRQVLYDIEFFLYPDVQTGSPFE